MKVRAAGVNPVDWKIRSGALGRDRALPGPMGREISGVVTAPGEGVDTLTVGHGGFAKHTLVRATEAVAKPEEISFADAATIPMAVATAYDAIHQIELEPGQKLLLLSAGGGVGLMAAQTIAEVEAGHATGKIVIDPISMC